MCRLTPRSITSRAPVSHGAGLLMMWAACALLVVLMPGCCTGFNFYTSRPITRTGPEGSLFGYSVAMHRQGSDENVLLVGAPRAQTAQPGVDRGGAVYRCPVLESDCEEVIFDSEGHPEDGAGNRVGSKSDQFFGATLHSAGPGGPVVACAPRRVWSAESYNSSNSYRFTTGSCFVANNDFSIFRETSPCEQPEQAATDPTSLGVTGISYCQAGISASVSQDNDLFLGAPGSFYWQGQAYLIDINNPSATTFTAERAIDKDNSYLGFAVARGRFGAGGTGVFVVSEPRVYYFLGQVHILDENLQTVQVLEGQQMSAYFGHSLAVTDLNGDGLDDLVVGAPMFIDPDNIIDKWEVGRVYVYCQETGGNLAQTGTLTGTFPGGQFGFSLAALGDVNIDGFNDIAVGAPFAGEDGLGLVYIFHGRRRGIRQTPSQEIRPADMGLNIRSFGASVSGRLDMDGNSYNDLLVGAYMSSTSVLIRSRPIVRIQKSLAFEPTQINLDIKDYTLPSGLKVFSFNITTCLTASGHGVPSAIDVKYSLQLDAQTSTTSRAAFVLDGNLDQSEMTRVVRLTTDDRFCQKDLAYVKPVIIEKNLPLAVRLVYELAPEEASATAGPASVTSVVPPVLSDTPLPVYVQSLPIKNTCKNYLCVPDLLLRATLDTQRVAVGDNRELGIRVSVTNNGEDAYAASFQATLPDGLIFVRTERITTSDLTVTCTTDENTGVVACDIGNPLPEEYTVSFGITIANYQLTGDKDQVVISMEVDSQNYEPRNISRDNHYNVTLGVYATAQLGLYGVSTPQQILYMRSNGSVEIQDPETEQEAGAEVTHLYMLRNLGPSEVGRTRVEIYWPMINTDGDYLLYLISAKFGLGEECSVTGGVNPDGLELEDKGDLTNTSDASGILNSGLNFRRRRQADAKLSSGETIECTGPSDLCVMITCNMIVPSRVNEDRDSALVQIRSRLYQNTLLTKDYKEVYISSTASAVVLEMPYMPSILPDTFPTATAQATVQVIGESIDTPINPTERIIIPFWVYIIAAVGGAIILALVVLGLWACGFFKRTKIAPTDPQAAAQENWQDDVLIDDKK